MPHTLILGMTESGKSTFAKWLCAGIGQTVPTIVLNPNAEAGWKCSFQSMDPDAVMEACQTDRRKAVFLDEAGDALNRDRCFNWFSTRSRHFGCSVWIITQRLTNVQPALRENCVNAIIFRCWQSEADSLADQFGEDRIREAARFPKFEFLAVSAYEPLKHGRIDFKRKRVAWIDDEAKA